MRTATFRAACLALSAGLLAGLATGCSALTGGPATTAPTASSTAASPSTGLSAGPTPGASSSATPRTVPNDFARGRLVHRVDAGNFELTVRYTTPLRQWTTNGSKLVTVQVTARSKDTVAGDPKAYLSRTSVNLALFDDSGTLDAPSSLTDSAGTSPGYLVNFPESYSNPFIVPAVNVGATELQLTFIYVIVSQVQTATPAEGEPADTSKDYTKQTAIDTVTVSLTS